MKSDESHVARLANLKIKEKEKKKFQKQLSSILEYISKLQEVDTKNIEITSQVTGLENILREDEVKPSLSQEEVLSNAKSTKKGLFKVKAILD
jgi:aspartyl-tRNA(Asn)/glutamyl-tRNA(Gln) amidotransferase subunit C